MRRVLFASFTALALLLPAAAFAQPGRYELTPFAGYRLAGDFQASSGDFFDPDLNVEVDESAVFGLLFDIPLAPYWQLEILVNRQQTAFLTDGGLFSPADELGDVDLTTIHGGMLFQWGYGQIQPFVAGSVGFTHIAPQFDELDSDDRFSASFAGGVKFFFAGSAGLRLEGRGYWTDVGTSNDYYDSYGGLFQWEGTVGLIFAF